MDIVEQLRLFAKDDATPAVFANNALRRASEIVRLREELEKEKCVPLATWLSEHRKRLMEKE